MTPNTSMNAVMPKNASSNLVGSAGSSMGMDLRASQQSIATVTSLMSTLCRESPSITQKLVQNSDQLCSSLISAACFSGDERIALDTMRFTDLLLMLIFTGRSRSIGCSDQNVKSSNINNNNSANNGKQIGPPVKEPVAEDNKGVTTSGTTTAVVTSATGGGVAVASAPGAMLIPPSNSPNSGASTPPAAMTSGIVNFQLYPRVFLLAQNFVDRFG